MEFGRLQPCSETHTSLSLVFGPIGLEGDLPRPDQALGARGHPPGADCLLLLCSGTGLVPPAVPLPRGSRQGAECGAGENCFSFGSMTSIPVVMLTLETINGLWQIIFFPALLRRLAVASSAPYPH